MSAHLNTLHARDSSSGAGARSAQRMRARSARSEASGRGREEPCPTPCQSGLRARGAPQPPTRTGYTRAIRVARATTRSPRSPACWTQGAHAGGRTKAGANQERSWAKLGARGGRMPDARKAAAGAAARRPRHPRPRARADTARTREGSRPGVHSAPARVDPHREHGPS